MIIVVPFSYNSVLFHFDRGFLFSRFVLQTALVSVLYFFSFKKWLIKLFGVSNQKHLAR